MQEYMYIYESWSITNESPSSYYMIALVKGVRKMVNKDGKVGGSQKMTIAVCSMLFYVVWKSDVCPLLHCGQWWGAEGASG